MCSDYMRIAEKCKEFFHDEGIHSTTIQPEFVEVDTSNIALHNCFLLPCTFCRLNGSIYFYLHFSFLLNVEMVVYESFANEEAHYFKWRRAGLCVKK